MKKGVSILILFPYSNFSEYNVLSEMSIQGLILYFFFIASAKYCSSPLSHL
jgi:hypothetical protein